MARTNNIDTKKCGIGTSALIICIVSIIFSFTSLGEKSIGVRFPVMVISIILFVIAIFIGQKYKENYFAKVGRNIGIFFIFLITILTVINLWFI